MLKAAGPVLIALVVAFAADPAGPPAPGRTSDLSGVLVEAASTLGLAAGTAWALGMGLFLRVRRGPFGAPARREVNLAAALVEGVNLIAFAYLIHGLRWGPTVRDGLGLRGSLVLDELAILLPYLLLEILGWAALYPAARAARLPGTASGMARHLVLRSRGSFGLVLPVVTLFWFADRLSRRGFPEASTAPAFRVAVMLGVGAAALLLAPAFVLLATPTRTLRRGPLRDRLERLARRYGFRFGRIGEAETGGTSCNAMIVGIAPWGRQVLLTDGLIDCLNDEEVEAVFAHEMGHVQHRHSALIGAFALGSVGVMALLTQAVEAAFATLGPAGSGPLVDLFKAAIILGGVAVYLRLAFGVLSRGMEREADVFGCTAVSCGRADCPPHLDSPDRPEGSPRAGFFCPVGVRICAGTLEAVADRSGIDPESPDWRHGTIASRVERLRRLAGRPIDGPGRRRERVRLRMLVALALAATVVLAVLTGAFEGAATWG